MFKLVLQHKVPFLVSTATYKSIIDLLLLVYVLCPKHVAG